MTYIHNCIWSCEHTSNLMLNVQKGVKKILTAEQRIVTSYYYVSKEGLSWSQNPSTCQKNGSQLNSPNQIVSNIVRKYADVHQNLLKCPSTPSSDDKRSVVISILEDRMAGATSSDSAAGRRWQATPWTGPSSGARRSGNASATRLPDDATKSDTGRACIHVGSSMSVNCKEMDMD